MKKRLRKKKHLGEFQELGFDLAANLRPELDAAGVAALQRRLVAAAEARQLGFAGGARLGGLTGFVARLVRGSATEDDRQALSAFLEGDSAVVSHELSPLRDAWYGWTGGCCDCSDEHHEH